MRTKIIAFLYLLRVFESSLIAGTGVLALIMLGKVEYSLFILIYFLLLLGSMGIFSLNDSFDINEDRVAHPERPIISGKIKIKEARITGVILILGSIVLSILINDKITLTVLVGVIIGVTYSFTSKSRFLFIAPMKNIVVASTTGLVLIALPWGLEVDNSAVYGYFSASMVILLFSYEMLKDIRDVTGDIKAGYNTLPILKGIKFSSVTSQILFSISCIVMALGFYLNDFTIEFIIALITSLIIIFPYVPLFRNPDPHQSDLTRYFVVLILFSSLGIISTRILLQVSGI